MALWVIYGRHRAVKRAIRVVMAVLMVWGVNTVVQVPHVLSVNWWTR